MVNVSIAAAALITARREGFVLDELPGGMPTNLQQAYAIQDEIINQMDEAVVGWKVAFTNKAGQQNMKINNPGAGPIFQSYVYKSPANFIMPDPGLRISECEFAFRLKLDLPIIDKAYTDQDIKLAIGSVHPAIEIINRRLSSSIQMNGISIITDHGGNAGFVYGTGTDNWKQIDFPRHPVRQIIDGKQKAVGFGQNVMDGNPIGSITWLANHLQKRRLFLRAGDWISSGSAAEMLPVSDGGSITGDFGSLGSVEVVFG